MAGTVGEGATLQFILHEVLQKARKQEHAQYFEAVGLSGFVSKVAWGDGHHIASELDMLELIRNFDRNLAESTVKGTVISLSVESVRTMFQLEDGGEEDEKMSGYSPKSFLFVDKGKGNRAYPLQSCGDGAVKERLEFQLRALHMKGNRVEMAALYQIQQVEAALHVNHFCKRILIGMQGL